MQEQYRDLVKLTEKAIETSRTHEQGEREWQVKAVTAEAKLREIQLKVIKETNNAAVYQWEAQKATDEKHAYLKKFNDVSFELKKAEAK